MAICKKCMINVEIINKLNKVIETAIDHGGDDGGPYFICPDDLYNSITLLLEDIDKEHQLEVIWKDKYLGYPIIKFK